MKRFSVSLVCAAILCGFFSSASVAGEDMGWREQYAYMLGKQAYIYGYPAINFAHLRYDWIEGHSSSTRALGNVYTHYPKLVDPEYQYGTSMNRDTLYSIAFSYVGDEPLVFTIGDNPDGRYYSIEFTEWYTDAFGYMGSITDANKVVNGWSYNPANWGRMAESGDFLGRAATQSLSGGIENLVEEAVKLRIFTDASGAPLDGSRRYVLRFSKEQVPVVDAFWSITLYDNHFNLVSTETNKYAVRDIDPNLVYGKDGSLSIVLQRDKPSEESVNWIPTPREGGFNLFFRAYLPDRPSLIKPMCRHC